MVPGPDARRTHRKIRRIGGYAALALPVVLIAIAYVRGPQFDWQWLAPSGWRYPALGSLYWRGFGNGHLWPIGAGEMCHRAQFERGDRHGAQSSERGRKRLGPEPQSIHARIHLDPDDESPGVAMRFE